MISGKAYESLKRLMINGAPRIVYVVLGDMHTRIGTQVAGCAGERPHRVYPTPFSSTSFRDVVGGLIADTVRQPQVAR